MAKKAGFKQILLAKGEKLTLYSALGVFGLFVAWGVLSAAGADDSKEKANELKRKADGLVAQINRDTSDLPPLPPTVLSGTDGNDFRPVSPDLFRFSQSHFEAVVWPSMRRENPRVLAPTEGQINYVQGPVKVFARKFKMKNDQIVSVEYGFIEKPIATKETTFDAEGGKKIKELFTKGTTTKPTRPLNRFTPQQGMLTPPMGGGNRDPMGNLLPMGADPRVHEARNDGVIVYKTLEDAAKSTTALPPAIVVRPMRMNVIQTNFPLKDQLEEIRRALRLRTIAEAVYESGQNLTQPTVAGGKEGPTFRPPVPPPMALGAGGKLDGPGGMLANFQAAASSAPVFEGIEVMRRVTPPGGTAGNWEALDHEGHFWDEFVRYDAPYLPDDGLLPYFLRPEQRLACPLPVFAISQDHNPGVYSPNAYPPSTTLPSIASNYDELRKKSVAPKPADEILKRFRPGVNNPYMPSEFSQLGSTLAPGGFNSKEPPRGPNIQGIPSRPNSDMPFDPNQPVDPNKLDVEQLLLRFVDTYMLKPGYTYEYRVRVRMRNPNYKKDNVARNTDAEVKELDGPWFEIPQKLTVPAESYLYAGDSTAFEKSVAELAEETNSRSVLPIINDINELKAGKRAVIQMQQWFESFAVPSGGQEQLGTWVVVNMPVTPGEYIGRKTYIQLPLWSAGVGNFTFRSIQDDLKKILGWTNTKIENLPRGYFLHDFRTKHLLIDFMGGKSRQVVGNITVNDEAASELLILREDGKIEVKNETADAESKERRERTELWTKWLKEVKERKDPYQGDKSVDPAGRTGIRTP